MTDSYAAVLLRDDQIVAVAVGQQDLVVYDAHGDDLRTPVNNLDVAWERAQIDGLAILHPFGGATCSDRSDYNGRNGDEKQDSLPHDILLGLKLAVGVPTKTS